MKTVKSILIVFIAISFMSCNSQQKKEVVKENVVELITVDELQKIDNSVQLIDVRTPKEYNEGYIKNAKNIDFYSDDFLDEMSKLNKGEPIYIYCKSGGRSGTVSEKLRDAGFTKVYDLEGGFMKWKSEDKIVTQNQ